MTRNGRVARRVGACPPRVCSREIRLYQKRPRRLSKREKRRKNKNKKKRVVARVLKELNGEHCELIKRFPDIDVPTKKDARGEIQRRATKKLILKECRLL